MPMSTARHFPCAIVLPLSIFCATLLSGHDGEDPIYELAPLEVEGKGFSLIGASTTSSEGVVGQVDLETRPILRTGEILESIPGMIVTQHSGTGKANQYFLRGFNLDHGTDFSAYLNGMPVNMRTHGHGQGYLDLNFIIPEAVRRIDFRKGPYHAGVGDFSSAGSAQITLFNQLPENFVQVEAGEDDYYRLVAGQTIHLGPGHLTCVLEGNTYGGPWEIGEDFEKLSGYASYSIQQGSWTHTLQAMAYDADWNSADQIPQRAVRSGQITNLGSIDDDVGGESSRYSLSYNAAAQTDYGTTRLSAYAIRYDLDLWSNFTYFLDDPVNGDEFEQVDQRTIWGFSAEHLIDSDIGNRKTTHRIGADWRLDDIGEAGLYKTADRVRLATTRSDAVSEWSTGVFYENTIHWSDKFKSVAGLRWDYYHFDVESNLPENSGTSNADLFSPKASFIYTASDHLEYFASAGFGFHSNDARGVTISVDPTDPSTPAEAVTPLVRTRGAESGVRLAIQDVYTTSLSIWWLKLDSELLFVGDAGLTEPSRPSRRYGVEWTNTFKATSWLSVDGEISLSEAEFTDSDPAGDQIPGAIQTVVQAGVSWEGPGPFSGALRMRYFDGRPLVEDSSVESPSSTVFNLRVGYEPGDHWQIHLDVLNLFDRADHDITYYYESRLPGEAAGGIADIHYHIIEPRTVRLSARYRF